MSFNKSYIDDADLFRFSSIQEFHAFNKWMTKADAYICSGDFAPAIHGLYCHFNETRESIWEILKSNSKDGEIAIKSIGNAWKEIEYQEYGRSINEEMVFGALETIESISKDSPLQPHLDLIIDVIKKKLEDARSN
jgi:hypothetical protein